MAKLRLRPRDPGSRCPFCHEGVARGALRCKRCQAPHHKVCLLEQSRCASCGCELKDAVEEALPATNAQHLATRRRAAHKQWAHGIALLLAGVFLVTRVFTWSRVDPEPLRVALRDAQTPEYVLQISRQLAELDPSDPEPGIRSFLVTQDPAHLLAALQANRNWTLQDGRVLPAVLNDAPEGLRHAAVRQEWEQVLEAFGGSPVHEVACKAHLLLTAHWLETGDLTRARDAFQAADAHAMALYNQSLWARVAAMRARLERAEQGAGAGEEDG